MNKRNLLIGILILFFGCSPKTGLIQPETSIDKPTPLFVIEGEEIDSDEFLYLFSKNKQFEDKDNMLTPEEFEQNLELFLNYKLKVKEAEAQGLDKNEEFEREFEMFKQDLIKPYLIKNSLQEGELLKAYNRMQEVVKASHILVQFPSGASKEDSIAVFRMAQKLKSDADNGADFSALAKEYSEDPSAQTNAGSLGYFTALQMVYQFEDAAYNLKINEISEPVLTDFGYHIIKLEDRKPNPGEVRVSHILVRSPMGDPVSEERALRKVGEIYHELQKPESEWEQVCRQFSEDMGTKNTGGKLPWISLGSVIPEFEAVAFALQEEGEISPPVKTPYGYHIIRLEERKPIAPYEEMEPMIKSRILRDSRSSLIGSQVAAMQKSRYGFVENESATDTVKAIAKDKNMKEAIISLEKAELMDQELFSIQTKTYTTRDFIAYLADRENQVITGRPQSTFESQLNSFITYTLDKTEEEDLEQNNEEYRMLLREYRDGILLFSLMNDQVWQKALEDSVGLQNFFQENQQRYVWEERINAVIVTMAKKESTASVRRFLSDKVYKSDLSDRLENTFLLNDPLLFTMEEGVYEWRNHPLLKNLALEKAFHEITQNGQTQFVIVGSKIPASPKLLTETRGKVIQDYQEYLDNMLIANLKEKFNFSIDENEKNKIYEKIVQD
ncbi:peptidylprolyl isomerase [Mongoliitalea daihaiensis]|uniref:peptidylprolyl isomerase n=1 Tax=Mongoliitalea daihaiensis TaxID=2782006 RepID=UPI001F4609CE|nr:peptidylprolyl isomerase [Mongoliitalea daihaiensis]UJP66267.1 peptidyl-prolyl cis-trans isomerase [Mongoliitalea daihaiensis]